MSDPAICPPLHEFTFERFESVSVTELRKLLADLRTAIQRLLGQWPPAEQMLDDDCQRFCEKAGEIIDLLNALGHDLYQADCMAVAPEVYEHYMSMDGGDSTQYGLEIWLTPANVEAYWSIGRQYRESPFLMERCYRALRDFDSLRCSFKTGQILKFVERDRNLNYDVFVFTQDGRPFESNLIWGTEGGLFLWEIHETADIGVWTNLFALVESDFSNAT